ncbi:hypothetical protein [Nocardioides sp. YIM 152315]|uniref:hypothetical protein n=1 Tax=Nocardioides sp. YIM 152315 TaxID=3031760 RepID=UPI0023DC4461|nr:hypothetical protein [Nocardioides sp. YIM 152315]MDF1603465.1 hypothetical protein [Nocardioides sp. YIM 152315]
MSTMSLPTQPQAERPSGRHPVNVGHLVMGIAFLGLVGVWALIQTDVVGDGDVRWLLPVPWVLAGLAGLLALSLSSRRKWSTRQVGWVDEPRADEPAPDGAAEIPDAPETTDAPDTTDTPDTPEEHR